MWRVWIVLGLVLSACAEFPEVDAVLEQGDSSSEYPSLVSFDDLLTTQEPRLLETDDDTLRARSAQLRRRANKLRGPVIDKKTRARMNKGVSLP